MKKRKEVVTNKHGLAIQVESAFCEKDDSGNEVNAWIFDRYNFTKCILYKDRTSLLDPTQERVLIEAIMQEGGTNG